MFLVVFYFQKVVVILQTESKTPCSKNETQIATWYKRDFFSFIYAEQKYEI